MQLGTPDLSPLLPDTEPGEAASGTGLPPPH